MSASMFYVEWRLLPESRHGAIPGVVYAYGRLEAMARNILALRRDFFTVRLYGAHHPCYEKLIRFLVASHKPLGLILPVNEGHLQWQELFAAAKPGQLRLLLPAAQSLQDLQAQMLFIGQAAENGQVAVAAAGANAEFNAALLKLREKINFDFVAEPASLPGRNAAWAIAEPENPPFQRGQYCLPGAAYMRIEPDGYFYNAPCSQALGFGQLWTATPTDLAKFGSVSLVCAQSACPLPLVIPRYVVKPETGAYASDLDPAIAARLRGLAPHGTAGARSSWDAKRAITIDNSAVEKIYGALGDADSREAFLRSLKAVMTCESAWLQPSGFPSGLHPRVSKTDTDSDFTAPGRFCQWYGPKEPLEEIDFATLRLHRPKVSLPLAPEQILAAPLALLDAGYEIYWGWHGNHAGVLYGSHPDQPQRLIRRQLQPGRVSIIIPFHDNADTLRRCLDSALIQDVPDLEIIAVDDASTDDSARIVADYAARWPKIVRWRHLSENRGPGYSCNLGMSMASGEFMAFIDADDALAPGFLKRGLEIMAGTDADIVSFDGIHIQEGKYPRIWNVATGEFADAEALRQLMLQNFGRYAAHARLYRTEFLRVNGIHYSDARVHQDMFFSGRAFAATNKVISVPEPGYLRFQRPGQSHDAACPAHLPLEAFSEYANFLTDTFQASGLSLAEPAYRYGLERAYARDREKMYRGIFEGKDKRAIDAAIIQLGSCRPALELILADYAAALAGTTAPLPVLPADRNWREAALCDWPVPEIYAHAAADTPQTPVPQLSVIIPSYNPGSYLEACLNSVLEQSMADFEVLVVDDASTDGSYELLCDYAARDSRIRLYRLSVNCRQGMARNIGMQKARGRYLIFVDADDLCLSDYFAAALAVMETDRADMAVFGNQIEVENGEVLPSQALGNGLMNRAQAMRAFWSHAMQPEPWAKIFRRDVLAAHQVAFEPYVYHQDAPFIFNALMACQRVATRNRVVYQRVYSRNSTMRPVSANWLQTHSAFAYYAAIDQALRKLENTQLYPGEDAGEDFIRWNLENVLLPKISAFQTIGASVPLADRDYELIRRNRSFLRALLRGAAEACLKEGVSEKLLQARERPSRIWHGQGLGQPLVSVILAVGNNEMTMRRAVTSILDQKSMPAFELLAVDSGSQDSSLAHARHWAGEDGRLRIVSANGRDSFEAALADAKGKYLVFANAEGRMAPDFLLAGCALLERTPEPGAAVFAVADKEDFSDCAELPTGLIEAARLPEVWAKSGLPGPFGIIWRREVVDRLTQTGSGPAAASFPLAGLELSGSIAFDARPGWSECGVKPEPMKRMRASLEKLAWLEGHFPDLFELDRQNGLADIALADLMDSVLPYLTRNAKNPVVPLADQDLALLRTMPEILALLLRDCARKFVAEKGSQPQLVAKRMPEAMELIAQAQVSGLAPEATVSILLYARNRQGRLGQLLAPLLRGSRCNLELIIIDDSSEDGMLEEALSLVSAIEPGTSSVAFAVYQTPWHCGRENAWNLGLAVATGQYVIFADAVDALPPWLMRLDGNLLAGADVVLAGGVGENAAETLGLYFRGESGTPLFGRQFLAERNLHLENASQPVLQLLVQALLTAKFLSGLPYSPQPLPRAQMPEQLGEWQFAATLELQEMLEHIMRGGSTRLRQAWISWTFGSKSDFMAVLLGWIVLQPQVLRDTAWLAKLLANDDMLRRVMLELALLQQRVKK